MASGGIQAIEKTNCPDGSAVKDFMALIDKYHQDDTLVYLPGDTFAFPGLSKHPGLKFLGAKAEQMPPVDNRDENIYEDFDLQLNAIVEADARKYKTDADSKKKLFSEVKKWLQGKNKKYIKMLNQEIVRSDASVIEVSTTLLVDGYIASEHIGDIQGSSFYDNFWNKHMNKIITEGVCYVKDKVPADFKRRLQSHIDEVAQKKPVDYHPNSNDIVRDLVHPALYPYIKGISKVGKGKTLPEEPSEEEAFDFWGRDYEDSKFQWLPTPFKITEDRKCLIKEYINNLDQALFPDLYQDLESLFEIFLPYFEEVWAYASAIELFQGKDDDDDDEDAKETEEKDTVSFAGQELQVIVKIVEYTLQPGQSYEGVWHAEGMSHENIVMTGIYFLDRSINIKGGDLRFKRAFTVAERSHVFWKIPQDRPVVVNDFATEGFMPLGSFPTEEGYLLVFPNCHIHKIAKMVNHAQKESASRRIVVFFVINPEKKIVSTREIPPQQNAISLNAAKDYRLELMAERKYDKEKLNVRDIELCEH